jgi:hypothetical protein
METTLNQNIPVKTNNEIVWFKAWESSDPLFIWVRAIQRSCAAYEIDFDEDCGIILICFDNLWKIRFMNFNRFVNIHQAWDLMYPNGKIWIHPEPAKLEIDKFLLRVNSLGAFL